MLINRGILFFVGCRQSCIIENMHLLDYPTEAPTAVQASAIEAILQDPPRHINVVSGASSGKTLAVCIAIAQRVMNEPLHQHVQALILSKDDGRARNVHHTLDCLLKGTGVNVRLLAPATEEYRHRVDRSEIDSETAAAMIRPLEHAHIIVGCHFAFSAPVMRTYFSRVELLVLDEFADSMWLQTIAKSLLLDLRHVKQALCFSARAPPASLQPVLARLQQPSAITIDLTDGAAGGVPPPRGWKAQMRHYYVDVHGMNKTEALEKLLAALNTGKMDAVIFSNVLLLFFVSNQNSKFNQNFLLQNQSECLALRDHMRGKGHTAFAICSQLMSDEECQFQRNSFINHLGTSTQFMFCGSLWSMVLWKVCEFG
jgi:superfamily II DNA/RNA helicase